MSAVHQVLYCYELLEAIFRQMSTGMVHPDDKPEDVQERAELRRALACAARACQAFSEPALNVLWCAIDNLVPLLKLIPGCEQRDSAYVLANGITEEGWSRLRHHALRIRGLCHYPGTAIHPSVWLNVMARSHGTPLLPRLRVLDVDHIPIADIAPLLLMLTPTLLELYLSFYSDADPTPPILSSISGMLLETITTIAPDLTIFYMDEHFPAPTQQLQALGRLMKLKELKLCDPETTVNASALRALSSLPSLRTLSIEDLRLDGVRLELEDGYRALETLYVHADAEDLSRLVRASHFVALKHVDFMLHCDDGRMPADHLEPMFTQLPQTIHNIRLGFCDGASTVPPGGPLADLLRMLQPLKGLLDLIIDSGARRLILADEDLKLLAEQWPCLRKFVLADDKEQPRPASDPCPTYSALVDLAQRCPALETLVMPCLDTNGIPPREEVPTLRHSLHWLEFNCYIGDANAEDIAEAIHRLFPTLEYEYNSYIVPPTQESTKPWHKVWDALQIRTQPGVSS